MNNKAFTLIEILVTVSLFSAVSVVVSGIFIASLTAQRRNLTYQQLLSQTSYVIEYMSRALRMAEKELSAPPRCLGARGWNYDQPAGNSSIRFIKTDQTNQSFCYEFYLLSEQLQEKKTNLSSGEEFIQPLTSSKLKITNLRFEPQGEDQTDDFQPRVTIFLDIKGAGQKPEEQPEIKIQTTVSQRNLDIVR